MASARHTRIGLIANTIQVFMQLRHLPPAVIMRSIVFRGLNQARSPEEKYVEFRLHLPQARSVAVAGTFNEWDLHRTPMRPDANGAWKATVWLPAGRYEYRFVADGQWLSDPNAKESVQNRYGGTNSVLVV